MKRKLLGTTALRGLLRGLPHSGKKYYQLYNRALGGGLAAAGFLAAGVGFGVDGHQATASDFEKIVGIGNRGNKADQAANTNSTTKGDVAANITLVAVANSAIIPPDGEVINSPYNSWPTATGFNRQKKGWYVRPEVEWVFSSGSFNIDNNLGVGLGASLFAGYRYAPASWSAQTGNVGFELGVGFFTPRLDKDNVAQPSSDGAVVLGAKTNISSITNMVSENFVNGVTQATTRTDVGLTTVSSANGVTVMLTSALRAATLNQTFSKNAVNNQDSIFATATGTTIGASASQVGGFVASGAAVTAVSLGNTTTTITFGQSQLGDMKLNTPAAVVLQDRPSLIISPGVIGVVHDITFGNVISGDVTRRINVNSSETVVVNNVSEGGSVLVRYVGPTTSVVATMPATLFIGSLSGTPTLIMNEVPVTQSIRSTNTDAVKTSKQTVVRTVAVSATTGFNVSETVSINAQLNKTETAASRNVTETTVTTYNRASAKSARIVVDSKEIYIPITIGANYSTPVGKSGFGFTAGLDVGAWVHNISREYYFTGGGGQNLAFTETTVKNYSDNKNIYKYTMGSASVAVSQLATEVKKTFTKQEQAQTTTSGLGSISLSANVGLNSTASFQYDPNNNSILIALNVNTAGVLGSVSSGPMLIYGSDPRLSSLITVNSTASIVISMTQTAIVTSTNTTIVSQVGTINISGTTTTELTTMTVTTTVSSSVVTIVSQTSTTNVSTIVPTIIRLYDSPIATTASRTGVLLSTDVIFFGTATPAFTISAGGVTATAVTNRTWTTGTFVATVSATSTMGTITLNAATNNLVTGINGVSAVITSTMAVAAGGAITTLLGTAVTIANNGSFTTETAAVRTLISSSTNVVSAVSDTAVVESGVVKMDQATQVKGVIIPKVSFNWSPFDNITFSLGGKLYIVIGGYSDYYSDAARAEAEARGIGYKKDELLWYGGLEFGAQFTF